MSIISDFLDSLKINCGKWTCSKHNCSSMQPAATFREIKKLGYEFEELSIGRWAKQMFCPVCNQITTHYKLLNTEPTAGEHKRFSITPKARKRIISVLGGRDAFTGASITSTPEIDHKVPWSRLDGDINTNNISDDEIKENFQLLTREHNLLKDRACRKCRETNKRPPLFDIEFWYSGDSEYCNTCEGCGWYDGNRWREELNRKNRQNG